MRIFDQGAREGSAYLSLDNPRIRKFRARYREGQIVHGTILEYDAPMLAWVLVEDLRVLAWVTRDYLRGQRLNLEITNLYPEIILKEVDLSGHESKGLSIIV